MRTTIAVLALALIVEGAAVAVAQTPVVPSRADTAAATEIEHRLSADKTVNSQMIAIDVRGGVATLTGRVPDQDAKERAERLASGVPNVTTVRNEITVGNPDVPDTIPEQVPATP